MGRRWWWESGRRVTGRERLLCASLSKDVKVGLGMLSNFGLAEKFNDGWAGRYYVKQSTLVGITFGPVASYRVNEQFSIGGGPNIMVGYMKTTANINNILPPGIGDGQLEVKDTAVGVGGEFGVLYEPKKAPVSASPITLRLS